MDSGPSSITTNLPEGRLDGHRHLAFIKFLGAGSDHIQDSLGMRFPRLHGKQHPGSHVDDASGMSWSAVRKSRW